MCKLKGKSQRHHMEDKSAHLDDITVMNFALTFDDAPIKTQDTFDDIIQNKSYSSNSPVLHSCLDLLWILCLLSLPVQTDVRDIFQQGDDTLCSR